MRITRVALYHWKGIENYALEDIDPGLNLILGDNETGKSRIAEAIWFGLFESSKGKSGHKEALRSWESTEDPKVEIDFEVEGNVYHLEKTFSQNTYKTKLSGPGSTPMDEDAEAELASLLGISSPGTRQVKDEELGMWPLLWIRQFQSGEEPHKSLTTDARARLQDLLSTTVGEVAAGRLGQKLLEMAQEERSHFYTDTGRPKKPLTDAEETVNNAREQLKEATDRRDQLEESADELRRVREDIAKLDQRVIQTRADLEQAEKTADDARGLKNQVEILKRDATLLERELKTAESELRTRREREDSLNTAQREADKIRREEVAPKEKNQSRLAEEAKSAEADLKGATDEKTKAKVLAKRAGDQKKRKILDVHISQLDDQLKKAKGLQKEITKLAENLGAIRLDKDTLETLKDIHGQWKSAQDTLLGASTRIRISALSALTVDGEKLAKGETFERAYSEPATISIDNVVDLEVTPGGEDLDTLREEAIKLEDQWKSILNEYGLDSIQAAEALFEERKKLAEQKVLRESNLEVMCPDGISSLESELKELEGERKAIGEDDPDAPAEKDITSKLELAETREIEKREAYDAIKDELSRVGNELGRLQERVEGYEREQGGLQKLLEKMNSMEEIRKTQADAQATWEKALATISGLEGKYEELGGDQAESDAKRLNKALAGVTEDLGDMRQRRASLDAKVRLLSDKDVHEKEQEAFARLEETEKKERDVNRKAAAAKKLADTLLECRAASQKRLLVPATEAIRRHLQVLFPGIDVALDNDLNIQGLQTANRTEELVDLSGGTREQIGMIVRLGLAELLTTEDGLPMVFDDALTNTDFRRIEQMHRILFKAAETLQILIFSCHPEAFEGIGAGKRYRLPGKSARRPISLSE